MPQQAIGSPKWRRPPFTKSLKPIHVPVIRVNHPSLDAVADLHNCGSFLAGVRKGGIHFQDRS
jgi:hypothetical protein